MIETKLSPQSERNGAIRRDDELGQRSNCAWLKKVRRRRAPPLQVLLLGGSDLISFRVRCAQAPVRADLRPSHWSHVALIVGDRTVDTAWFAGIEPFGLRLADVPVNNNIEQIPLTVFDDPARFPNIALLQFPLGAPVTTSEVEPDDPLAQITAILERTRKARAQDDLVTLRARWQSHVLAASGAENPLQQGISTPCARLADIVYGAMGIDISPGVGAHALCPEAIWNAAQWWTEYYDKAGKVSGSVLLRQPDAAAVAAPPRKSARTR